MRKRAIISRKGAIFTIDHKMHKFCKTSIQLNSNTFNNTTHQIVMSSVGKFEQFSYNFAPCNIIYR